MSGLLLECHAIADEENEIDWGVDPRHASARYPAFSQFFATGGAASASENQAASDQEQQWCRVS